MSAQDKSGQKGQDDVRNMLRQLATQIKDQIGGDDRRSGTGMREPDRRAAVHDEHWDADSAEALTRMYEEASGVQPLRAAAGGRGAVATSGARVAMASGGRGDGGKPGQPVYFSDPPQQEAPPAAVPQKPVEHKVAAVKPVMAAVAAMTSGAAAMPAKAASGAAPTGVALASLAADRDWLDARLADLQRHVEGSLAAFDPEPILKPMTARIDALEGHIVEALGTLAQKADDGRLATIETDLASVKEHVEAARGQLQRLDGIEVQLRELHAFATEVPVEAAGEASLAMAGDGSVEQAKRLEEIEITLKELHAFAFDQQHAQAAPADLPDLHGLAEKAAERAAQNIVEQHKDVFSLARRADLHAQAGAGGASIEDMQKLLEAYSAEHRIEQGQTASALATMQEALIRLIDRIEELAGEGGGEPQVEMAGEHEAPRYVEVQDERLAVPGRRASDKAAMASHGQPALPQAAPHADHAAPAVALPPAAAQDRMRGLNQGLASEPVAPASAPAMSVEEAAAALAAERARVQSERQGGRRSATPRPQVRVANDEPAAASAEDHVPRKAGRMAPGGPKKIITIALAGAAIIGAAFVANSMLGKRVMDNAKMDDRVPRAAVETPAGNTKRPGVVTETIEAATPRPTPALPEGTATGNPRAQPASGAALPEQPAPREAPAPQVRPVDGPGATRRPTPETVTDDLSFNTQPPAGDAQYSTAAVQGITLDTSGMLNPAELARRQARLAPSEAEDTGAAAIARTRPDMPPPQIGPTSLRLAAQNGDPAAAYEVAVRYAEAKGVKQDFQQALIWYSRAAQQGFVPAQYRLATIYEGGLHGTQDLPRAKVWYKRAAEQGNVKAMHNLAVLAAGNGAGQNNADYQTAARWFGEAAERGLADSQFNLGVLHESGLGVAKDAAQAYKWFALAARSGDKEAIRRRDQLLAGMKPRSAAAAEKSVQSWRAKPTDLKANDARAAAQAMKEIQGRMAQQAEMQMQQRQQQAQAPSAQPEPTSGKPTVRVHKGTPATLRATGSIDQ